MEFSDFRNKKQIQSGQIRKILEGVAGSNFFFKLLLTTNLMEMQVFRSSMTIFGPESTVGHA